MQGEVAKPDEMPAGTKKRVRAFDRDV